MTATDDKIKRFMEAQSRAKKIIQMDANGGLKKYAKQATQMAESALNEQPMMEYQSAPTYNEPQRIKTNSKLPKEILESFQNKQIDMTPLSYGVTTSILDEVNHRTQGQLFKQTKQEKQHKIVETTNAQQPNIDYSMIKMIVEDCMKKYTSALKKSILNESKTNNDNLKAMKIGDKFSFITNNGDLYEANLKFIKNINKKG